MSGRRAFLGREFTRADNQALPYTIRVLPSGAYYATIDYCMRRLDALKGKTGFSIALPMGEWPDLKVFIRYQDGLVLIGDEIARGKKDEPPSILKANTEAIA